MKRTTVVLCFFSVAVLTALLWPTQGNTDRQLPNEVVKTDAVEHPTDDTPNETNLTEVPSPEEPKHEPKPEQKPPETLNSADIQRLLAKHREATKSPRPRAPVSDRTIVHPDRETATRVGKAYVVKLKRRTLIPGRGADISFDSERKTILLQFWRQPIKFELDQLAALGVTLRQPTSGSAWHAEVARDRFEEVLNLDNVRGVAPIELFDRLEESVAAGTLAPYAIAADGRMRLVWRGYKGTVQDDLLRAAVGVPGLRIGRRAGCDYAVFVEATHAQALDLASLDITHWIEPIASSPTSFNVPAAQASGVEQVYGAPNNLTGAGVNVMILDGGAVRETHLDLAGRITVAEYYGPPENYPYGDHATHVAGTIAGTGVTDPTARGMASGVNLFSYSFHFLFVEDQGEKLINALNNYGCVLSNHSWGYTIGYDDSGLLTGASVSTFGQYTGVSAHWDDIILEKRLIVVKAAGNDRDDGAGPSNHDGVQALDGGYYDLIGPLAGVKNLITVGAASDTANYLGADGITAFSNFGPTDDGRIKPEVVFNGDTVNSCSKVSDTSYVIRSGTSMATPGVTGTLALLMERYNTRFGSYPGPEWAKAVLTGYATDLGRLGPDYQYGFGIVDAITTLNAIDVHATTSPKWLQAWVLQGFTNFHLVYKATDGTVPLIINCVWLDDPGDPAAGQSLVVDLDMWVSPLGSPATKYYPWSLGGLAAPDAPATQIGANSVDSIEQVTALGLPVGWYVVNVEAVTGSAEYCLASYQDLHPAPNDDSLEPNDTAGAAVALGVLPNTPAMLTTNVQLFDDDWYTFDLSTAGPLALILFHAYDNGRLNISIFSDAGITMVAAIEGTANLSEVVLSNVPAGTYWVRVSGVAGATNNHYSLLSMRPAIARNLEATSLRSPALVIAGNTINISVDVDNTEWGQTGLSQGEVRLSLDATIDVTDQLLATFAIPALTAYDETTLAVTVPIPLAVAKGPYYIGAILDTAATIAETNESDNVTTDILIVLKPDDAFEENDTLATATPLTLNSTYTNLVLYDFDIFSFTTAIPGRLTAEINFAQSNGDLDLGVIDGAINLFAISISATDDEIATVDLAPGTYYVVVEQKNPGELGFNDDYSLRVAFGTEPAVTSTAPITAVVSTLYTYALTASGSPAPTFTVAGLPAWLNFDGTATISGTPTAGDMGASVTITVTATNGVNPDASQVFTVTVNGPPTITNTAPATATVGSTYSHIVAVTGFPLPTVAVTGLPPWLAFNAGTNTISGTPASADIGVTGTITITASNGVGADALQTFQITVSAAPPPPASSGGGCGAAEFTIGDPMGIIGVLAPWLLLLLLWAINRRKHAARA